jgi:hypothetical protein
LVFDADERRRPVVAVSEEILQSLLDAQPLPR